MLTYLKQNKWTDIHNFLEKENMLRHKLTVWVICHLMVAPSFAYGGVDAPADATALHRDADVFGMTGKAADLPHLRQHQRSCHDNQLHPLPGAVPTPTTGGSQR